MEVKQEIQNLIIQTKEAIQTEKLLSKGKISDAEKISDKEWTMRFYSKEKFCIETPENEHIVTFDIVDDVIKPFVDEKEVEWNTHAYAGLIYLEDALKHLELGLPGKKYTREGMIQRVLEERKEKAKTAKYHIQWADNIYGEHVLTNDKGKQFKVTIHDFEEQRGYIDNVDWQTNKLGTTKHIIYLCEEIMKDHKLWKKLDKRFPFVEIYLDPNKDYAFSWFYAHDLEGDEKQVIEKYFGEDVIIVDEDIDRMQAMINEIGQNDRFMIRSEVYDKMERIADAQMLEIIQATNKPEYSVINAALYPYQKEGVEFALFKKAAIIADEMGLGKTIQAIAISLLKKQIFDFGKCLIVCPASLKHQWKKEIEKFSDEVALVVQGFPNERAEQYINVDHYFFIINYETVLRDSLAINNAGFDFIILDEAQRIKNYETKTASAIQRLKKKHGLVLTGTPIENKLIDLYSIMLFLDRNFLTPLWEFSYQHCLFDQVSKNKITGYYNLNELNKRLQNILIRREKHQVLKELPNVIQEDVPVKMSEEQMEYHRSYAHGVAQILHKKFKTPFDWQKLMLLLTSMRMVADSTFLIDKETNISPKLVELKHILTEKIDIHKECKKILIFSEWINMLKLIEEMLMEIGVGYTVLTGKVPVKKRHKLIEEFETNDDCKVFLSTESGGTGLNLQVADTVINFELPWNPAKKNQRIGRINRIGQKNETLTVINLISIPSIELSIAAGLELKQNLFEGVLNEDNKVDTIDFSDKGRAQFIKELEAMFLGEDAEEIFVEEEERAESVGEQILDVVSEVHSEDAEGDRIGVNGESVKREDSTEQLELFREPKPEEVEEVFTKGLDFLSGLYKMSTGKDLMPGEGGAVKLDKETGEVTIKFKIG